MSVIYKNGLFPKRKKLTTCLKNNKEKKLGMTPNLRPNIKLINLLIARVLKAYSTFASSLLEAV
jgi:hypothetical protein